MSDFFSTSSIVSKLQHFLQSASSSLVMSSSYFRRTTFRRLTLALKNSASPHFMAGKNVRVTQIKLRFLCDMLFFELFCF